MRGWFSATGTGAVSDTPIPRSGTCLLEGPAMPSPYALSAGPAETAPHKWLQAFHLLASSKKGVSSHQLHRTLKISYEAAWFMAHRIRECMRDGGLTPLGGSGKIVEADETYHGKTETLRPRNKYLP